ncbi:MAG: SIP domain-containing protein [Acidimicrobiales bacterium]
MTREPLRAPVSVRGLTPTHRPVPASLFGGRYGDSYLLRLEVAQVEDIAPHVRSLTVASTDLLGFNFTAGQDLMLDFPQGGRTLRRRYTIRRADPDAGTADLEFEIHDGGGVAACWAADTDVGSRLEAIGPRGVITVRPDSESHIFVTDDSAIPATFAMIEALPPGATATAFLVSPHGPESRPVPLGTADTRIRWVEETRLPEAIRESALPRGVAAYALGERRLVLSAVDLFVRVGVDRDAIASKAYWRRDQPNEARGEPARD